jgi:hypothetical protein
MQLGKEFSWDDRVIPRNLWALVNCWWWPDVVSLQVRAGYACVQRCLRFVLLLQMYRCDE